VAAVLCRDRKATAEFVSLHADGIYAFVWNRLLPRTELVEDIVQDVFLAALDSLSKFQGTSSLRSWLLGIARHKVEDCYRARLRESLPIDEDEAELLPVEPELDEYIDRERLAQKVWQVLKSLPEAYCLALLWRYWENRSACEMAAQTGRTEKAVERLLARAREQFKRRWNDESAK
jgi:RNA polymerase sigma-70 factor (ECF subfamily)